MAAEKKYVPEPGKIVVVPVIPNCAFCLEDGIEVTGPYDFKTSFGPWANGCKRHWNLYKAGPLGVGSGQLWITADQVERTPLQQAKYESQKERGWDV